MASYSFPLLDKNDVCAKLAKAGAPPLSVENLLSPCPEALLPVYDFFASDLVSPDNNSGEPAQLEFPYVQMLGDHPEWYIESNELLKTLDRVNKYMQGAGVQDFSFVSDICRPEPSRTVRFLSAIINFTMFCGQKHDTIAELKSAREEALAKLEEVSSEESKMEMEIAHIEQERASESPQVEALERELKEQNTQLQGLNKQQLRLQVEINNLKQEDATILDKISSLDFEIMQKRQQGAHVGSQIIENPEESQKILQEKKASLADEETLGKRALGTHDTWKAKFNSIEKAEKKALKLLTLALTVEDQVKNRDIDKALKERKARRKAIENESWACEAVIRDLTWGVSRLEALFEDLSQDRINASHKLEAVEAKQDQCRMEYETIQYPAVKKMEMQTEAQLKSSADLIREKTMQITKLREVTDALVGTLLAYAGMITPTAEMREDMEAKIDQRKPAELKQTP